MFHLQPERSLELNVTHTVSVWILILFIINKFHVGYNFDLQRHLYTRKDVCQTTSFRTTMIVLLHDELNVKKCIDKY